MQLSARARGFESHRFRHQSLENQGIAIGSLPAWIHDFECCTFDHSDNSPCLFSSGFLSRNLLKNSLERKQERRQKIFDFEIFCVEEYQGESGGRNSQIPPKFRVSPVMTTSIPLHINHITIPYIFPSRNAYFRNGGIFYGDDLWTGDI